MEWITVSSIINCGHDGRVTNLPRQTWVRVEGAAVLVDDDPESRAIVACPNAGPTMKPCAKTLRADRGYSTWLRVDGHRIVLSNLDGLTDGTLPGTVHYTVRNPMQRLVGADG